MQPPVQNFNLDNSKKTVAKKTKIITPGGCSKNSTIKKKQTSPIKHLTTKEKTNPAIIKKNSTVRTTKITKWLAQSKQTIKSQSTKKRVQNLNMNNLPPTTSNSSSKTTTHQNTFTSYGISAPQSHKNTQSQCNYSHSNRSITSMENKQTATNTLIQSEEIINNKSHQNNEEVLRNKCEDIVSTTDGLTSHKSLTYFETLKAKHSEDISKMYKVSGKPVIIESKSRDTKVHRHKLR